MAEPKLYGPDGRQVNNVKAYVLGNMAIESPDGPNELFIKAMTMNNAARNPLVASMFEAVWANAAVSISSLANPLVMLQMQVAALERILFRVDPAWHAAYLEEVRVVQEEFRARSQAASGQHAAEPNAAEPNAPVGDTSIEGAD